MSSKARVVTPSMAVAPVSWAEFSVEDGAPDPAAFDGPVHVTAGTVPGAAEQEAFAHGYAQGERAGLAAANADAEALQRRLTQSLDELIDLRARIVRQAERDTGHRAGLTTDERQRLKELVREVRELKRANEILRKASAYFAQAELDRRAK